MTMWPNTFSNPGVQRVAGCCVSWELRLILVWLDTELSLAIFTFFQTYWFEKSNKNLKGLTHREDLVTLSPDPCPVKWRRGIYLLEAVWELWLLWWCSDGGRVTVRRLPWKIRGLTWDVQNISYEPPWCWILYSSCVDQLKQFVMSSNFVFCADCSWVYHLCGALLCWKTVGTSAQGKLKR